jgi:hypothetical protein
MAEKKLPRGIRNNNRLNIRKGNNWKGEVANQTDGAFEQFVSMQMGVRAGFKILKNYMTGYGGRVRPLTNVHDIIHRWAPPNENNCKAYIESVCRFSGLHEFERLQFADRNKMLALVDGMIRVECGQPVELDIIASAYDLINF